MIFPKVSALALLLIGFWLIFHGTLLCKSRSLAAMSNASAFQSKLNHWILQKIEEGKLTETDRMEIFTASDELLIGGESKR